MHQLKLVCGTALASILLFAASCTDSRYDLDRLSGEVTIGGESLTLPLGYIPQKTLSSIIGTSVDELKEEDGIYVLNVPSAKGTFSVSGIEIPDITDISPKTDPLTFSFTKLPTAIHGGTRRMGYDIDFKGFDFDTRIEPLRNSKSIPLGQIPSGSIPAMGEQRIAANGSAPLTMDFSIADEIKRINTLWLKSQGSPDGARFTLSFDLNGLSSVNGGGRLSLSVRFPQNYKVEIRDAYDGHLSLAGSTLTLRDYPVAQGASAMTLEAFITSIDMSSHAISGGMLSLNDAVEYDMEFVFDATEGYVNGASLPAFTLATAPQYSDASVTTNRFEPDDSERTIDIEYDFNGISTGISAIEYIAFTSSSIYISLSGAETITADCAIVDVHLPDSFVFGSDPHIDNATNILTATIRELTQGISLPVVGADGTSPDFTLADGTLAMRSKATIKAHAIPDNTTVLVSSILPETSPLHTTLSITADDLAVDIDNSRVEASAMTYDIDIDNAPEINQTIEVPAEVRRIDRIELAAADGSAPHGVITLSMPDGVTFPVDEVIFDLNIYFPEFVRLAPSDNISGNRIFVKGEHWRPNEERTKRLIDVTIEALENLPAISNGAMDIKGKIIIAGTVTSAEGADIVSSGATVDVNIDIPDLRLTTMYGIISPSVALNKNEIVLGDISDETGDMNITDMGLTPEITLSIDNPVDIDFLADIRLTPKDREGNPTNDSDINIEGLRLNGGKTTHLFVSEASHADRTPEGYDFLSAPLGDLLRGDIPYSIDVAIDNIRTDETRTHVIDLTRTDYSMNYECKVRVPLSFDHTTDISYSARIDDLNETFSTLSEQDITVGDISIEGIFSTTIPVDMTAEAQFVDAEGNPTPAQARLPRNRVAGHKAESGEKESVSNLTIELDIPDGDLKHLADIAALEVTLRLTNDSEDIQSLRPEQYIAATFKATVRGGVTIDVFNIDTNNEEEE